MPQVKQKTFETTFLDSGNLKQDTNIYDVYIFLTLRFFMTQNNYTDPNSFFDNLWDNYDEYGGGNSEEPS